MILSMFDSFLAQILVLFLLYISAARIFFLREPRVDVAAVVCPFAFLISLSSFFIWGFSFQNLLLTLLSFLFLLTNFRALIRVISDLLIDHYSLPFLIATLIEILMLIAVTAVVVLFSPVRCIPKDFSVQRDERDLTGNFSNGFFFDDEIAEKVRGKVSGKVYIYTPTEKIEWISSEDSIFNKPAEKTEPETATQKSADFASENAPIILFVGTPYASVANYEPYLIMLSQKGLTVIAADFFSSDMSIFSDFRNSPLLRRTELLRMKFDEEENFKKIQGEIDEFTKRGYEALSRIALVNFRKEDGTKRKIYYVTDGLDTDAIFSFSDKFADNVAGVFQLESVEEYKTSKFGFPEQTDIFLAKSFGLKRDSEFFIPRYLAFKTVQKIANVLKTEQSQSATENNDNAENGENKNDEPGKTENGEKK